MKHVLLNRHNLAVAKLAPKSEDRYTLNAIQVTENATVVTNGHYLVHIETPKQDQLKNYPNIAGEPETVETDGFLMDAKPALEVLKAIPKEKSLVILNHAKVGVDSDGNVRAITTDLETTHPFTIRKKTGQFPNWKAVIPNTPPTLTIGLNAEYMAALCSAMCAYNERSCFFQLQIWDANRAVRMDAHDSYTGQHFTAVLMPMRGDVKDAPFQPAVEPIVDPFADVPEYVAGRSGGGVGAQDSPSKRL